MKRIVIFSFGLAALVGCQTAPPVKSVATGKALRDATRVVLLMDTARAAGCSETPRITTQPIYAEPGELAEQWTLERCGQTRTYSVRYITIPGKRGTNLAITADGSK